MTFFVMWSSMPGITGLPPHSNYALPLGSSCKKDRTGSAVTFPVRPLLHPCSGQESIFHPVWDSEGMTGRPLRECWAAAWAAVLLVWSWWIIGHGCFILSPWIASPAVCGFMLRHAWAVFAAACIGVGGSSPALRAVPFASCVVGRAAAPGIYPRLPMPSPVGLWAFMGRGG